MTIAFGFSLMVFFACEKDQYDLKNELARIDSLTVQVSGKNLSADSLKRMQNMQARLVIENLDPTKVDSGNRIAAAKLYLYAGLIDSAITVLQAYKETCPDTAQLLLLFEAYWQKNRPAKAEMLYRNYLQHLDISKGRIYRALFSGYRRTADYERALFLANEARMLLPLQQVLSLALDEAELYWLLNRREKALQILDELSQSTQTVGDRARISARRNLFTLLGKKPPELHIQNWLGSDSLSLQQHQGSVLLFDFWAPHCQPCKKMLPVLNKLRSEYSKNDLKIFGITRFYGYFNQFGEKAVNLLPHEELEYIKMFRDRYNISYPIGVAEFMPGQINNLRYGVSVMPHKILIDRSGTVRAYVIGADRQAKEKLYDHIAQLVSEPA